MRITIGVALISTVACVSQTDRVIEVFSPTMPADPFAAPSADYPQQAGAPTLSISDGTGSGSIGDSGLIAGPLGFFVPGSPGSAITPVFGVTPEVSMSFLIGFPTGEELDGVMCAPGQPLAPCSTLGVQPLAVWAHDEDIFQFSTLPPLEEAQTFFAEAQPDSDAVLITVQLTVDTTGWREAAENFAAATLRPLPPSDFMDVISVETQSELTLSFTLQKVDP